MDNRNRVVYHAIRELMELLAVMGVDEKVLQAEEATLICLASMAERRNRDSIPNCT